MTPTAKQQLEDLLNEALDEQRQLAIQKVQGIISTFRKRYEKLLSKEDYLRQWKNEEMIKWRPIVDLVKVYDREIDLVNADKRACLDVISLLKEELGKL